MTLGFQTSDCDLRGTVREEISAVSSHQVSGDLSWWPQDTHTPRDVKTQRLHMELGSAGLKTLLQGPGCSMSG